MGDITSAYSGSAPISTTQRPLEPDTAEGDGSESISMVAWAAAEWSHMVHRDEDGREEDPVQLLETGTGEGSADIVGESDARLASHSPCSG